MLKICVILSIVVLISSSTSAVATSKTVAFNAAQRCAKQHGIDFLEMKRFMKGDFESKTEKAKVSNLKDLINLSSLHQRDFRIFSAVSPILLNFGLRSSRSKKTC